MNCIIGEISRAEYPKMSPYPIGAFSDKEYDAWKKDVMSQQRDLKDIEPLKSFFAASAKTFLSDTNGQCKIYSPLDIYMALSMLAELTDEERQRTDIGAARRRGH